MNQNTLSNTDNNTTVLPIKHLSLLDLIHITPTNKRIDYNIDRPEYWQKRRLVILGDAIELYQTHHKALAEQVAKEILKHYYEVIGVHMNRVCYIDRDHPEQGGYTPIQLLKALEVPEFKVRAKQGFRSAVVYALENNLQDKTVVTGHHYQPYSPLYPLPKIEISPNGQYKINNFMSSEIIPIYGNDAEPMLNHINYLCDEVEADKQHLLNWLAYNVQHPENKIKHAILLGSQHQGTGKSTVIDVMRQLLGTNNTNSLSTKDLSNSKQDWLNNKVFIAVEEVKNMKPSQMNNLKRYITEDSAMVDVKFGEYKAQTNYANFIFTTNEERSLYLDEYDRRYFIIFSKSSAKEPEYYLKLNNWMWREQGLEKFYGYLLERSLYKFNPNAPPPNNQSKLHLVDNSKSDLEIWLEGLLESYLDSPRAFRWKWLENRIHDGPFRCEAKRTKYIQGILKQHGFTSKRMREGDKKQTTFWFNPKAIAEGYLGQSVVKVCDIEINIYEDSFD